MIAKIKFYTLLFICLILLILFTFKSCELDRARQKFSMNRIPDTVYVSKSYKVVEIKKEYIEKPVKVYVYLKDTSLRQKAEHSDIITGINIRNANVFHKMDFIKLDKINPQGIITSMEYQMPPLREIKIDFNGNLQGKKKRFTGLKTLAGTFILGTAGIVIYKGLHK